MSLDAVAKMRDHAVERPKWSLFTCVVCQWDLTRTEAE